MIIGFLIAIAIIVLDQLTKIIFELVLDKGEIIDIIPNFFYFTKTYNTGAAWSMLDDSTLFLAIVSLVATIVVSLILKKVDFKKKKLYAISLAMILGGTAGNMIDRFLYVFKLREGVVDFLGMYLINYAFPIYNLADTSLVCGCILLSIEILFFDKKEVIEEKEDEKTDN